jgi:hypothetical protein
MKREETEKPKGKKMSKHGPIIKYSLYGNQGITSQAVEIIQRVGRNIMPILPRLVRKNLLR